MIPTPGETQPNVLKLSPHFQNFQNYKTSGSLTLKGPTPRNLKKTSTQPFQSVVSAQCKMNVCNGRCPQERHRAYGVADSFPLDADGVIKVAPMSDDDFDNIVSGMGEDSTNEQEVKFSNMTDVIFHYWKLFNPGSIPIKTLYIMESTHPQDGRILFHESSSPSSEWEVLGMMESVQNQIRTQTLLETLGIIIDDSFDESEEDSDD